MPVCCRSTARLQPGPFDRSLFYVETPGQNQGYGEPHGNQHDTYLLDPILRVERRQHGAHHLDDRRTSNEIGQGHAVDASSLQFLNESLHPALMCRLYRWMTSVFANSYFGGKRTLNCDLRFWIANSIRRCSEKGFRFSFPLGVGARDARQRNTISKWKNCAQRRAAQSRDAVRDARWFYYADEIVLRSDSFPDSEDRQEKMATA